MNTPQISGVEAARALSDVRARQAQVIAGALVPNWFWAVVGAAMAVFIAAVDSQRPWLIGIGTVLFLAGIGIPAGHVITRRGAQVRNQLLGWRGGLAIAGFVIVLVGAALGISFGLHAAGVPYAGTAAAVTTGVGMAVGGPLLMRHLRTLMTTRPVGGRS
ncbi:MAG TPA: hypothetical protein VF755_12500 [Catenuloplanes sp.]|jgi:purine-cytosine permease-like protein